MRYTNERRPYRWGGVRPFVAWRFRFACCWTNTLTPRRGRASGIDRGLEIVDGSVGDAEGKSVPPLVWDRASATRERSRHRGALRQCAVRDVRVATINHLPACGGRRVEARLPPQVGSFRSVPLRRQDRKPME